MPFKSKAQARYLFSLKPKIAEEFARKTTNLDNLPNKVKRDKDSKPVVPKS